jgi:uncharacterized membrane protein YkoI
MTRRHASLLAFIPLVLVLGPMWALSFASAAARAAAPASAAGALTMDQAVKMAEKRFHARVVKAETQREGGGTVYVLRLLNDTGHVWTVRVNAANGAVH